MAAAFWPKGLDNLTEIGEYRQYSLGIKLRQIYSDYLTMDSSQVLALSSSSYRCIKSLEKTIQGLFNIEVSSRRGLDSIKTCKKPSGCLSKKGGFANDWKSISINTTLVPSLNWAFLDKECAWRQKNKSPLDTNGLVDKDVASLPGIERLGKVLKSRYNAELNYDNITDIWAQVLNELELAVTNESFSLSDHFRDWIFEPVGKNQSKITLYDVLEAATLLMFRDRTKDRALRIQNGPIVTSLVDSFRVALNKSTSSLYETSSLNSYKSKKIVLYSTHDHSIILLMNSLNLLNFHGSFEKRFHKYSGKSDIKQFVNGIRMPSYGVSLKFELTELKNNATGEELPVVAASLYDKEDAKFSHIHYHRLKLGKACRKLLKRMYPDKYHSEYYKKFQIDTDYICPFELFEKVTSNQMVNHKELVELCHPG